MFVITTYSGTNDSGEQSAGGWYLILASGAQDRIPNPTPEHSTPHLERVYGCVRYVRMTQVGHFMMGSAQVGNERLTLSGPYGHDGLPFDYDRLSERVRKEFTRLSDAVTLAYWKPEYPGHNSTGSEKKMMRKVGKRLLADRTAFAKEHPDRAAHYREAFAL